MSVASRNGRRIDAADLKARARGRWPEVLSTVCGIDQQALDGNHHPCPRCGGRDRFRLIDADAGALFCNQCFSERNGDGIAAVQWALEVDFNEACERLADHLQAPAWNEQAPRMTTSTDQKRNDARKFGTWKEAAADAETRLGKRSREWVYQDCAGRDVGAVCRWDLSTGKTVRPFAESADGGWQCSAMPDPRPLFGLPQVLKSTGRIWVCEGEKPAETLQQIGLTATTSSGGSQAAKKTDWSALAGRDVVIWPDHDGPGQKYGEDVRELLAKLDPVPTVRIIDPAALGLKEAEDAADWCEARDAALPEDLVAELQRIADEAPVVLEAPKRFRIEFIDSGTFANADYHAKFLVKRVLVHGQHCIMGGAQKTLKTSVAVDLAISLGTGTRFLGEFEVPEAVPVGLLSGESGAFTLQETARRVARSRGRLLSDAQVYWGFKLPQLGLTEHLQALTDAVGELGLKCLIVDPAYLCLLRKDDGSSITFSNVFEMGAVLGQVSQAFAGLDCTPIILHHESKSAASFRRRGDYGPPELSDLSMAGFAEWARQWLLLARREQYQHGSGVHRLWLNAGGSAGHGCLSAVDIDEGHLEEDFTGRKWDVTVAKPDEVRQAAENAKESRKTAKDEERDQRDLQRLEEAYAKFPDGETARAVRSVANLSGERFPYINQKLIDAGRVEPVAITKKTGTYDGFRLVPQDVDPSRVQELFSESEAH